MKTFTVYLNNTLLCQTIFALKSRVTELNNRPDLDPEILTHTQAALDLFSDVLDGKECPLLDRCHQSKGREMTEPEAIQLVESSPYLEGGEKGRWIVDATAELRKLHEENERRKEIIMALYRRGIADEENWQLERDALFISNQGKDSYINYLKKTIEKLEAKIAALEEKT